jgi:hypothetical protein
VEQEMHLQKFAQSHRWKAPHLSQILLNYSTLMRKSSQSQFCALKQIDSHWHNPLLISNKAAMWIWALLWTIVLRYEMKQAWSISHELPYLTHWTLVSCDRMDIPRNPLVLKRRITRNDSGNLNKLGLRWTFYRFKSSVLPSTNWLNEKGESVWIIPWSEFPKLICFKRCATREQGKKQTTGRQREWFILIQLSADFYTIDAWNLFGDSTFLNPPYYSVKPLKTGQELLCFQGSGRKVTWAEESTAQREARKRMVFLQWTITPSRARWWIPIT